MSKSKSFAPVNIFSKPSNEDPKAVDIYLYGAIPDIDWDTWNLINTDKEFVDQFREAEKNYDVINIHINSPGGVITEGLVMFNTIRSSKKEVHTWNDGMAASMGAIVLAAGHTVHAPETSIIMLHNALGGVIGNKDEIRDYADSLEVFENTIISALAKKIGTSEEDVKAKYFDGKDHFMTGKGGHEIGLVDQLEDYEAEGLPDGIENMTYDQIVNHFSNNNPNQVMNLKDFFSGKAKAENKTVEVKAEELNQLRTASEEAVAKIEELETSNNTLTEKLNTANSAKETAETALKAEQEAHATTTQSFKDYKAGTDETHSFVPKDADDLNPGSEPQSKIRKDEAAARAQGEKIYNKKKDK